MLVLSMLGTADSGIIKTSIFLNNSQLGTQERKKNVNKQDEVMFQADPLWIRSVAGRLLWSNFVPHPNTYVEILMLNVMILGGETFGRL